MNRSIVEITVLDYTLKPCPKAKVVLTPPKEGKEIALRYDRARRAFVANDVAPGAYIAHVEANGFKPDQRGIEVVSGTLRDRFILGKEGMPAYYRGRVRVPFEPTELVAASLRPQDKTKWPERFDAFTRELKLERQEVSDHVTNDFFAVFRVRKESDRDRILKTLRQHDSVRFAGPVVSVIHDSVSFLTNELIVRFKDHVDDEQVKNIAAKYDAKVERTIPYAGNAYLLRAPGDGDLRVLGICDDLVKSGQVIYAEPNLVTSAVNDFHPNDAFLAQQTHHPIIGSEAAWDTTVGSSDIIVGVMDSGCQITHADFQNPPAAGWTKIYQPFDFIDMDTDPTADSHGTKSNGIVGACANNDIGVAGVAPGCKLLPMRRPSGFDQLVYSDAYIWAAGFDPHSTTVGFPAAIAPGADIISSSFGLGEAALSGVMKDCFDFVTTYGRNGKGTVMVFSVGNDDSDFTTYRQWAAYEKTIAVGASTLTPPDAGIEHKASSSNFGSMMDLCAPAGGAGDVPGESRSYSTSDVGGYASFGQTSCACPQVSGSAALLLSVAPALTWVEVRQILRDTANKIDFANVDPIGQYVDSNGDGVADFSQWYGFGRLDVAAAVTTAHGYPFSRDIYVRDNLADTGNVASAGAFWATPDLWVRNVDPALDGAAALPASYASAPPDQQAHSGHDNWIYVRFRNRGTEPSYDFYVRVYLMHFAGLEFRYPADFIPTTRPSDPLPSPLVPGTYLVGEAHIASLDAGTDNYVAIRWPEALIPPETVMVGEDTIHWHPCLLAEISPHDGPVATGVHVWDDNNLAQRNVTINYAADDDFNAAMIVGHRLRRKETTLDLVIERGEIGSDVELSVHVAEPRIMEALTTLVSRNGAATKGLKVGKAAGHKAIIVDRKLKTAKVPMPHVRGYVPIVIHGRRTGRGAVGPATIVVTQFEGKKRTGAAAIVIRQKKG